MVVALAEPAEFLLVRVNVKAIGLAVALAGTTTASESDAPVHEGPLPSPAIAGLTLSEQVAGAAKLAVSVIDPPAVSNVADEGAKFEINGTTGPVAEACIGSAALPATAVTNAVTTARSRKLRLFTPSEYRGMLHADTQDGKFCCTDSSISHADLSVTCKVRSSTPRPHDLSTSRPPKHSRDPISQRFKNLFLC